jgi:hypothetical protein
MTKRKVRLDQIRIDGDTQFRKNISQKNINYYAECMEEGDVFPPMEVTFDGSEYWLWNGFHRYHAYAKIGIDEVEIDYRPGTQEDAQDLALGANSDHGFGLTKADKKNKVQWVLSQERYKGLSNIQIAALCKVSDTFVAAERDPAVRKKQEQNRLAHYQKKVESGSTGDDESGSTGSGSTGADPKPSILDGSEPSDEELQANDLAMKADMDTMTKLLESDEQLATAFAEIKRLNHLVAQKDVRIAAIMREKSECIKLCQKLQKENDKLKGKK